MVKLRLFELLLIGFIVAVSIPMVLLISGDLQTMAKTAVAGTNFLLCLYYKVGETLSLSFRCLVIKCYSAISV